MMTSVSASPPHRTSRPSSTQAAMAQPNVGTSWATAAGFLNTPEPITVPTTRAVAIHGPSTRSSCGGAVRGSEGDCCDMGAVRDLRLGEGHGPIDHAARAVATRGAEMTTRKSALPRRGMGLPPRPQLCGGGTGGGGADSFHFVLSFHFISSHSFHRVAFHCVARTHRTGTVKCNEMEMNR